MKKCLKKIKDWFYDQAVRRIPEIQFYYENYVDHHKEEHRKNRLKSWGILLRCNFNYYFLHQKPEVLLENCERRKPYLKGSESALSFRVSPEEFAKELTQYDVISFDMFDTLVYRPFQTPLGLFDLLGAEHRYLNFRKLRSYAEYLAREKEYKRSGSYEVSIADIYQTMEEEIGISSETGIKKEQKMELKFCFANPYMKRVYDCLIAAGKTVVVTSDMYLTQKMLTDILENCGYTQLKEVFVSSEFKKSKHEGSLFQIVRKRLGNHLTYVHIGDNPKSDVEQAKKNGFMGIHYSHCGDHGNHFRATTMSPVIGSAYAGIVNSWLHNGLNRFSVQYEYGFVYGGLFVLGYCNFIHRYAVQHQMDKILFLSRDGDILSQCYQKLYPDDPMEYVYWSRRAAVKLAANRYKFDYFVRFIDHNVPAHMKLKKVISAMELDRLAEKIQADLGCSLEQELNPDYAKKLRKVLNKYWTEVLQCYAEQHEGAKAYYSEVLKNCKRVCAVDIGWAGSGAASLNYLVREEWGIDCEVYGLIAGTNTVFNVDPDTSEPLLQSGQLTSYLYAQNFNRDFWFLHNPGKNHNVYFEMLLGSNQPSLKGFGMEQGSYRIDFCDPEVENFHLVEEIQRGILDFAEQYTAHFQDDPYMFEISGNDAYAPFRLAIEGGEDYFQMVMKNLEFKINIV